MGSTFLCSLLAATEIASIWASVGAVIGACIAGVAGAKYQRREADDFLCEQSGDPTACDTFKGDV